MTIKFKKVTILKKAHSEPCIRFSFICQIKIVPAKRITLLKPGQFCPSLVNNFHENLDLIIYLLPRKINETYSKERFKLAFITEQRLNKGIGYPKQGKPSMIKGKEPGIRCFCITTPPQYNNCFPIFLLMFHLWTPQCPSTHMHIEENQADKNLQCFSTASQIKFKRHSLYSFEIFQLTLLYYTQSCYYLTQHFSLVSLLTVYLPTECLGSQQPLKGIF